jgi:hypothetical protein
MDLNGWTSDDRSADRKQEPKNGNLPVAMMARPRKHVFADG